MMMMMTTVVAVRGMIVSLLLENRVDRFGAGETLEVGHEIEQLGVVHVVEPRVARHGVVRMKDVRGGRVVQDEHFVEIASETTQVFHVVATVVDARLAEQTRSEHVPLVEQVRNRISILDLRERYVYLFI